jgi:hypothetical protein
VVAIARTSLSWDRVMDIHSIRASAKQLKRNIAKLKKKENKTEKVLRAIEKAERKLSKKIAVLDSFGVSHSSPVKKKKKQTIFRFGDYDKYIRSSEWAARKASYYETHHKRCRSCGDEEKEMHLHHRSYARIYQEADGDLIPMCVDCHAMLHLFQKSFKLPVEDATELWLSVTNGTSRKKKIREALRQTKYSEFEHVWKRKSRAVLPPTEHLSRAIEMLVKGDIGSREDVISDPEPLKKAIAFSKRTGIIEDYDAKVDALMRRLAR